jgi:predicted porin
MLNMKKIVLVLFLIASQNSFAGYLIEPYFGQFAGDRKLQTVPSQGSVRADAKLSGGGFGLQAAYAGSGWWLGVDFRSKDSSATINEDQFEFSDKDTGVILGARFANGIRLYGEYIWDAQQQSSNTTDPENHRTTTFEGTGMRIGAGYIFGNQVTLNVDYTMYDYKKATGDTEVDDISTVISEYEYAPIMVSVGYAFGAGKK